MKISELKNHLVNFEQIDFELWNGVSVPAHYHITEIGLVDKNFMDCGGETRKEQWISLQLWIANDTEHRLASEKLLAIIEVFQEKINSVDLEVEVEYQGSTIGRYGLKRVEEKFVLIPTKTDCLAKDACGIQEKECCGGGCC